MRNELCKEKICYCQSYLVIHLQIGCDGTKEGGGDKINRPAIKKYAHTQSLVANLSNQVRGGAKVIFTY